MYQESCRCLRPPAVKKDMACPQESTATLMQRSGLVPTMYQVRKAPQSWPTMLALQEAEGAMSWIRLSVNAAEVAQILYGMQLPQYVLLTPSTIQKILWLLIKRLRVRAK